MQERSVQEESELWDAVGEVLDAEMCTVEDALYLCGVWSVGVV